MLLPISAFGCIDQIDLKTNNAAPVIVVDGLFTNLEETQLIKISESIDVNSQIPVPVSGAQIFVEDQDGNKTPFIEQQSGHYMAEAKAEKGNQYRLFGTLPDGRVITSNFQHVPDTFPVGDISLVDTMVFFTDESGDKRRLHSLDFYANVSVNSVPSKKYLRVSPESVYQVSEIVCSPFAPPPKVCYIYNDVRPIEVNLFEIDATENPVQFNNFIFRRKIDYAMGEVFALNVRLYSYNKTEYEYWEKLKLIFDQDGNITDTNPARIIGNITADDGSEIQGQFAVVGKSKRIKIIRNADFPTQQFPLCGYPGLRPYPLPSACCGCQSLSGATLNKPDYWP